MCWGGDCGGIEVEKRASGGYIHVGLMKSRTSSLAGDALSIRLRVDTHLGLLQPLTG